MTIDAIIEHLNSVEPTRKLTANQIVALRKNIQAYANSERIDARLTDNHDWDTETFKPIIVCRRCATTYQTKGNKPCKGKMAKVTLRSAQLSNPQEEKR